MLPTSLFLVVCQMDTISNQSRISANLVQGIRFQNMLARLPQDVKQNYTAELDLSPDKYGTSVGQAIRYRERERDAYVDATNGLSPPVNPTVAPSAATPAGFSNVKQGDLPHQGIGPWVSTTPVNGSKGASTSSNTSHTKSPASGTKKSKKHTQTSHRNWWDEAWLKKHEHKS